MEMTDASTNQIMAFSATQPTALPSPMRAMPVIKVETTSGAMIKWIPRRKIVVTRLRPDVMSAKVAGSVTSAWQARPATMPSNSASSAIQVNPRAISAPKRPRI